jgi:hypothetical protein
MRGDSRREGVQRVERDLLRRDVVSDVAGLHSFVEVATTWSSASVCSRRAIDPAETTGDASSVVREACQGEPPRPWAPGSALTDGKPCDNCSRHPGSFSWDCARPSPGAYPSRSRHRSGRPRSRLYLRRGWCSRRRLCRFHPQPRRWKVLLRLHPQLRQLKVPRQQLRACHLASPRRRSARPRR